MQNLFINSLPTYFIIQKWKAQQQINAIFYWPAGPDGRAF
jgi:hypothetical protein